MDLHVTLMATPNFQGLPIHNWKNMHAMIVTTLQHYEGRVNLNQWQQLAPHLESGMVGLFAQLARHPIVFTTNFECSVTAGDAEPVSDPMLQAPKVNMTNGTFALAWSH
jgi:hypothetical protein